jgi:hypothetical protein
MEIELSSFLGVEESYWQGNSLRTALPTEVSSMFDIPKSNKYSNDKVKQKLAFYSTDKGLLVCKIDEHMEEKFIDMLSFSGEITEEDLKFMFERGIFP